MRRIVSIMVVVCVFVGILSACVFKSDQKLIEDRIESFLKAYNAGDLEAVLECLDAKTRNTYRSAFGIGNALIGMTGFGGSLSDMFGLGVGLMSDRDVMQLRDLEIVVTSPSEATVRATMYYNNDLEHSSSQKVQLTLVKEDGDWFIHDLNG
ncbi:MAG: hypothetical protein ACI3V3_02155 [Faecousia sp.]